MAADERKIVIELKSLVGSSDDDEDTDDSEEREEESQKAVKRAVKQVGTVVWHEIKAQVDFSINRYLTLSEDYKNAIRYANVKTTISKIESLYQTAKSGFLLGSAIGGGGGAVAGAVIGATINVVTTQLELRRQYSEQDLQLALNDRSAGYARSKLGLIDNGRGTYN